MNQIIQELRHDPLFEPNHRESSEFFDDVVYANGDKRVIVCKGGSQWILQRRAGAAGGPHRAAWRATDFITSRKALIRLWRESTGFVPPEFLGLPSTFALRTKKSLS